MEGEGADRGETVDVAEVELSTEKEESAEEGKEEDGAGEVRIVHYVLVDVGNRVEDCKGLVGNELVTYTLGEVQLGWGLRINIKRYLSYMSFRGRT